jgi:predicted transcriptional regulator
MTSDTDNAIRRAVVEEMARQGITQTALAERMGVTRSHVSQMLSGYRGKVPESLVELLAALGLELTVKRSE